MYLKPLFFSLLAIVFGLFSACNDTQTSSNPKDGEDMVQSFANTNNRTSGRKTKGYKPKQFKLSFDGEKLLLEGKGARAQSVSTKGKVVVLGLNHKDQPVLQSLKQPLEPVEYMGIQGPYFYPFQKNKTEITITSTQEGGWTLQDKSSNFFLEASAYDCEDLYFTGDDGQLYLVAPPQPIHVTVDGFNLNFRREGKDEGVNVDHENGIILAPCDEIVAEPRSFVYQAGGLGTVILVDNIIDPELVEQASNASASDAYQAEGFNAFLKATKREDQKYKGAPCPSIDDINWSDTPLASIAFAFPETSVTIYCDTWLVIDDGKEKKCVNIVTCGAKLEVDGDRLHVYSGCSDAASQSCPF